MSLKVELRPGERLLVGDCIITNGDQRARLFIDGKAPVLREKDILTPETANTPARRIYLAVQMMYLAEDVAKLKDDYFAMIDDIVLAAPSMTPLIHDINNEILTENLYKALRAAKRLIDYEQDILAHAASGGTGLPADHKDG